jgi:redox-sensitive bicupin YhaK (pirin superfamily)
MLELRKSDDRGTGKLDWLEARFTFSFGPYQDPAQPGFSDLKLLNDDRVAPGGGFATHEHKDMEVFSYVMEGALEHKDSMGVGSVVPAGDVIVMSAGTGITHSEFNHSKTDKVRFVQVWMMADRKGVAPRYQQKHFSDADKRGRLCLLLSPDGGNGAMGIYQSARVYAGLFDGSEHAELALAPDRYAYVHVLRGSVSVNGTPFGEGDGARVRNERKLVFSDGKNAEVLVFDLRPLERPEGS